MRRFSVFSGALLTVLVLAVPAVALEDGIMETASSTPNDDSSHAEFDRVITNLTEGPIDVAPRDLRMAEYPILTVIEITAGSFDDGIWTIGSLEGGRTASIVYTGAAAPEELPRTGQQDHLAAFALAGVALIGLGTSMLRTTRG